MSKDKNGNEVAILLLDSQGTFDRQTTTAVNSFIFGFSIAVSSVMIYNLMGDINEQSLDNLLVFAECFRALFGPFQEAKFVVRDWNDEERHAFGSVGGQNMVDEIFGFKELESMNASAQLVETRQLIRNLFETTSCCLLPAPGEKLIKEKKKPITVDYLNNDFRHHINELCTELFVDQPTIRTSKGLQWTGKTFLAAFDEMQDAHANGQTVDPGTFREAMVKRRAGEAAQLVIDSYISKMEKAIFDELKRNEPVPFFGDMFLVDADAQIRTMLLEEFDTNVKAFNACPEEIEDNLNAFLDKWLSDKRSANNALRELEEKRLEEKRKFDETLKVQEAAIASVKQTALEAASREDELKRNFEQYKQDMTEKQKNDAMVAIAEANKVTLRWMEQQQIERQKYEQLMAEERRENRRRDEEREAAAERRMAVMIAASKREVVVERGSSGPNCCIS